MWTWVGLVSTHKCLCHTPLEGSGESHSLGSLSWAPSRSSISTVSCLPSQLMQSQCAHGISGTWRVGRQIIKIRSTPGSLYLDKQQLRKRADVCCQPAGMNGVHTPISQTSWASRGLRSRTPQNKQEEKSNTLLPWAVSACSSRSPRDNVSIRLLYGPLQYFLEGQVIWNYCMSPDPFGVLLQSK